MTNKMINTETELLNVVDFVKQTWVLPNFTDEELISFIRIPFEAGLEGGKNWCKNTKLSLKLHEVYSERCSYLKKEHDEFLLYDGYDHMIHSILDGFKKLENSATENWDYCKFCSQYISQARKIIGRRKIHPKPYGQLKNLSYKKIREDFEDFDTLGYWDKDNSGQSQEDKEKSLFKGIDFEHSPFISRITLHNVLQSDVNQGRNPLHELISAIITYGLNIAEYNNTAGAIEVIKSIKLPNEFQYSLPELPKHKFLQACYYVSENEFQTRTLELEQQIIENKKKINSLTPEELAKRKEEQRKGMNEMLDKIINEVKSEEKNTKKSLTLTEVYKIFNIKNF